MSCTVEARESVRRTADALEAIPAVTDARTSPPLKGSTDDWEVEAVVECPDGIPPSVHREIAIAGLYSRPQPSSGDVHRIVATA